MTRFLFAFPILLALALPLGAQNVVLDEGVFRLTREGREIGTETFKIRRVGQGAEAHVIANAVIELDLPSGREQVTPLLRAAGDLSLSEYQLEVSGREPKQIAVILNGRRFVARTRTASVCTLKNGLIGLVVKTSFWRISNTAAVSNRFMPSGWYFAPSSTPSPVVGLNEVPNMSAPRFGVNDVA